MGQLVAFTARPHVSSAARTLARFARPGCVVPLAPRARRVSHRTCFAGLPLRTASMDLRVAAALLVAAVATPAAALICRAVAGG